MTPEFLHLYGCRNGLAYSRTIGVVPSSFTPEKEDEWLRSTFSCFQLSQLKAKVLCVHGCERTSRHKACRRLDLKTREDSLLCLHRCSMTRTYWNSATDVKLYSIFFFDIKLTCGHLLLNVCTLRPFLTDDLQRRHRQSIFLC